MRRSITALAACLALGACGGDGEAGTAPGDTATTSSTATQTPPGTGGANTAEVVGAARAFLGTLTPEQRELVVHDVDDDVVRRGWPHLRRAPRGATASGSATSATSRSRQHSVSCRPR